MAKLSTKTEKRDRRRHRVRAKVFGDSKRPRLSVFKSNRGIYAQIIDDEKGHTLLAIFSLKSGIKNTVEGFKKAGTELAKSALAKGIKTVVFDRGGYIYTGKLKSFAEGAREGGLKF